MLICRALVTFQSKYGFLRAGERVTVEPQYFAEVNRTVKKLQEIKPDMQPSHRQVIERAPLKKDQTTERSPRPLSQELPNGSGEPQGDGQARLSQ